MDPATAGILASLAGKLGGSVLGASRTNINQTNSQSSNTSVGFNPVIALSVGGAATGSPSGGASGSAAATSSGGGGGANPWGSPAPVNSLGDLPQATGGMFGGLLNDPMMLVLLAAGGFLLFGGLKKA